MELTLSFIIAFSMVLALMGYVGLNSLEEPSSDTMFYTNIVCYLSGIFLGAISIIWMLVIQWPL